MEDSSELDKLRNEIRDVTVDIMQLAGRRLLLARKLGAEKRQRDLPVEDLEVERELKKTVLEKCREYGVEKRFSIKLLNLLIDQAKQVQKELEGR
jgi:chorismate mutase